MVETTVGASVPSEKKARLIEAAGANGKTVSRALNDLIDGYLADHGEHQPKELVLTDEKGNPLPAAGEHKRRIHPPRVYREPILNKLEDFSGNLQDGLSAKFNEILSSLKDLKELALSIQLSMPDNNPSSDETEPKLTTDEIEPDTCGSCGAELPDNATFCPYCNVRLIRDDKCPECGTDLTGHPSKCPKCGGDLKWAKAEAE